MFALTELGDPVAMSRSSAIFRIAKQHVIEASSEEKAVEDEEEATAADLVTSRVAEMPVRQDVVDDNVIVEIR